MMVVVVVVVGVSVCVWGGEGWFLVDLPLVVMCL